MNKKEEYTPTKISPVVFAVLLIIVLLMFAIGRIGNKHQNTIDEPTTTTTTTTEPSLTE